MNDNGALFYFSLCYPSHPDNECVESSKKNPRKIEDECRTFNTEWTYNYFFTNFGSKAVCLICQESVAVFMEYNLKRHFQTKHGILEAICQKVNYSKKPMTW